MRRLAPRLDAVFTEIATRWSHGVSATPLMSRYERHVATAAPALTHARRGGPRRRATISAPACRPSRGCRRADCHRHRDRASRRGCRLAVARRCRHRQASRRVRLPGRLRHHHRHRRAGRPGHREGPRQSPRSRCSRRPRHRRHAAAPCSWRPAREDRQHLPQQRGIEPGLAGGVQATARLTSREPKIWPSIVVAATDVGRLRRQHVVEQPATAQAVQQAAEPAEATWLRLASALKPPRIAGNSAAAPLAAWLAADAELRAIDCRPPTWPREGPSTALLHLHRWHARLACGFQHTPTCNAFVVVTRLRGVIAQSTA